MKGRVRLKQTRHGGAASRVHWHLIKQGRWGGVLTHKARGWYGTMLPQDGAGATNARAANADAARVLWAVLGDAPPVKVRVGYVLQLQAVAARRPLRPAPAAPTAGTARQAHQCGTKQKHPEEDPCSVRAQTFAAAATAGRPGSLGRALVHWRHVRLRCRRSGRGRAGGRDCGRAGGRAGGRGRVSGRGRGRGRG